MTAENIVEQWGLTREELDEFALASQQKAEAAIKAGKFKDEIVPVEIPQRKGDPIVFDTDEHPKFGSTIEKLDVYKRQEQGYRSAVGNLENLFHFA